MGLWKGKCGPFYPNFYKCVHIIKLNHFIFIHFYTPTFIGYVTKKNIKVKSYVIYESRYFKSQMLNVNCIRKGKMVKVHLGKESQIH
jgi:hypothetical protein